MFLFICRYRFYSLQTAQIKLRNLAGLDKALMTPMLKTIGIGILTQISATVCADCFLPFAREELRPFEYILGEEMAE